MVDLGLISGNRKRRGPVHRVPGGDVMRAPAAFYAITFPTYEIPERAGDLSFVLGGEYDRQTVLSSLRALEGATHTATLHLKSVGEG